MSPVVGLFVAILLQVEPAPPAVYLDTTYAPPTGATLTVPAGGDFQSALGSANPGDTIVLQAGATYTGNFTLPTNSGSAWIYIKSSGSIPAPGTRVTPANAPGMARILSPNSAPAISATNGAHHFRFVGLEITCDPSASINYTLVSLGDGTETSIAQLPHDITVDRCYVHGNPAQAVKRGVQLNGALCAVIDSWVSDCHNIGQDTQAVAGFNGSGPFKIVNNELQGAAENVIFGGADPVIPNLVPSDIEIRLNHIFKPLSWRVEDPSYAGYHWTVKNLLELKNARRVLIDGNVIEYNWTDAQTGFAILFTPRNQDGTAPWSAVQDITFTNNIVRHSASAFNISGYDSPNVSQQTRRVRISNNLFDDINGTTWNGDGRLYQVLQGTADVTIEHNTAFQTGTVADFDYAPQNSGLTLRNNIAPHNLYGVFGSGVGTGTVALNTYCSSYVFLKNVLPGGDGSVYPADNFFPPSMTDVGFVDLAGGNYHLAASSPYKNAGTDGKDIGCDIDALNAAISGAVPPPSPGGGAPPPATATDDSSGDGSHWHLKGCGATGLEALLLLLLLKRRR